MTTPTEPKSAVGKIVVLYVLLALIGAGITYVGWRIIDRDESSWTAPDSTGEKPVDALAQFYDQELTWDECGTARCSTMTVPVDYAEPDGDTLELSVRLYPATDGTAERTLFVNPGGPGGSATEFAGTLKGEFTSADTDVYDVVGVDPRGVGDSTPLQCLDDAEMDAFINTDPQPDDAGEIDDLREATENMAEACAANSGDLASHVSTHEVARDMDIARALMGRDKLDWFGASYGTQLGATYANLFPENVGRMVLDGAVDPSVDSFEAAMGQTTGFQRAFDAYAEACVKQDDCPLGPTVEDARQQVSDFLAELDEQPIQAGDRQLTQGTALFGIALPLYSEELWGYLTQGLTGAFEGDATMMLVLSDAYFSRQPNGEYKDNIGQVIYAVNCLDAVDRPSLEEVEKRLPEFEEASPVFGSFLGWGVLSCTDWPLTSETPQGDVSAEGAPPIIVIGTTRDPATPYEWARSLADQLKVGVLVSRDGDGHTAFASGNDCIDDLVEDFFVNGTVPEDGTMCEAE